LFTSLLGLLLGRVFVSLRGGLQFFHTKIVSEMVYNFGTSKKLQLCESLRYHLVEIADLIINYWRISAKLLSWVDFI
jgi:hypothetical protein